MSLQNGEIHFDEKWSKKRLGNLEVGRKQQLSFTMYRKKSIRHQAPSHAVLLL